MAFLTAILRRRFPGRLPRRAVVGLMLWTLLAVAVPTASAQVSIAGEDQIKAVFLFNFAQFVDWPAKAFPEKTAPFVIGVLGTDPFGTYLDDLLNGEKVGGRSFHVERYRRVEEIGACHILFISRSEARNLDRVLPRLKGRSIFTVSDIETFTRQGGMVRFATENGKVRLRINLEAAKEDELTISSKILRPGTVVTPGKD